MYKNIDVMLNANVYTDSAKSKGTQCYFRKTERTLKEKQTKYEYPYVGKAMVCFKQELECRVLRF